MTTCLLTLWKRSPLIKGGKITEMLTCGFLVFNKREEEERCLKIWAKIQVWQVLQGPCERDHYKHQLYEVLKWVKPFPLQLNCLCLQMQNWSRRKQWGNTLTMINNTDEGMEYKLLYSNGGLVLSLPGTTTMNPFFMEKYKKEHGRH